MLNYQRVHPWNFSWWSTLVNLLQSQRRQMGSHSWLLHLLQRRIKMDGLTISFLEKVLADLVLRVILGQNYQPPKIDTWIMLNTFYISMLLQITSHFWVKLTWLVPFWYVLQDKSCRVFVVARLGQRSDTSLAGALRCTSAGRYSHGEISPWKWPFSMRICYDLDISGHWKRQ